MDVSLLLSLDRALAHKLATLVVELSSQVHFGPHCFATPIVDLRLELWRHLVEF